ncbi:MAG: glycosyl transferase [Firmicutes bacterium HGW-Firmicutes-7]|nr:MAG: glycosyl transferase [Firmicutes bacterium HGW-Firmicutes-7]
MDNPKISVVIPSFNHEKYIAQAIESVLFQTFGDFELLIGDDCSKDQSREIINNYKDSRIKTYFLEEHLGAVEILEFLIRQSKGDAIALLNSDDYWLQGKLEKQYEIIQTHPELGACFTWADIIDENNTKSNDLLFADLLKHKNRSQGKWLQRFFYKANCLCHPSILINKKVYNELGYYKHYLRQLPDLDMWVRLIKKYPIHMLEETLVIHRRHGSNSSAYTNENLIRGKNELYFIYNTFFDNISDEIFLEGFEEKLINNSAIQHEELICEQAFLLLNNPICENVCKRIGLNKLAYLLQNKETRSILKDKYGFTMNDFFELMAKNHITC